MAKRRRNPVPTEDESSSFDALFFGERPPSEGGSPGPEKPVQRNAANARERARMRVLSRAFSRLKTSLPWVPPDTKLSKLDTLRLAATYIAHLRKVLKEDSDQELQRDPGDSQKVATNHPITFTWPFTINNRPSYADDMTTPTHDNKEMDFAVREVQSSYESYPPCEYMTLGYSELPRRDVLGHYLQ